MLTYVLPFEWISVWSCDVEICSLTSISLLNKTKGLISEPFGFTGSQFHNFNINSVPYTSSQQRGCQKSSFRSMTYLDLRVCAGSPPHAWHHSFTTYLGPEVIQGIFIFYFYGKWGAGILRSTRTKSMVQETRDRDSGSCRWPWTAQAFWSIVSIKPHTVRTNSWLEIWRDNLSKFKSPKMSLLFSAMTHPPSIQEVQQLTELEDITRIVARS